MKNSGISWTDHTFNFWIGCEKISPECRNCYAKAMMDDRLHKVVWGRDGTRVRTKNWKEVERWNREAAIKGVRYRVFVNSLSDFFEDFEGVNDWRMEALELIEDCKNLDWLILSKHLFNNLGSLDILSNKKLKDFVPPMWVSGFPPHVRLGATIGSQHSMHRLEKLINIPAKNFLSMEPLLESLHNHYLSMRIEDINWVIVGGGSQQGKSPAQPFHLEWAREISDLAEYHRVPYFFKQAGSNPYWSNGQLHLKDKHGRDLNELKRYVGESVLRQEFPE